MTIPGNVLYRVDGSFSVGMGHVMRSLSLSREVLHPLKIQPFFLLKGDKQTEEKITHEGFHTSLIPEDATAGDEFSTLDSLMKTITPVAVITDVPSLQKKNRYENIIKQYNARHIVFDDLYLTKIAGDIIINNSVCRTSDTPAKKAGDIQYFTGPRFTVISKPFREKRKNKKPKKDVISLVVSLGGSDPGNLTSIIIKGLLKVRPLVHIQIVIGPAFKQEALIPFLDNFHGKGQYITIHTEVKNLADILSTADLAVVSGGITAYETACLGIPFLIACQTAAQEKVSRAFEQLGVAINLGCLQKVRSKNVAEAVEMLIGDHAKRKKMARRGRVVVDGRGLERIKRIFETNVCV